MATAVHRMIEAQFTDPPDALEERMADFPLCRLRPVFRLDHCVGCGRQEAIDEMLPEESVKKPAQNAGLLFILTAAVHS